MKQIRAKKLRTFAYWDGTFATNYIFRAYHALIVKKGKAKTKKKVACLLARLCFHMLELEKTEAMILHLLSLPFSLESFLKPKLQRKIQWN